MKHIVQMLIATTSLFACTAAYQGPFSKSYEANQKVLSALKDAGSDLSKPHAIEHHFDCNTKTCFERVIELGRSAGHTVAHEGADKNARGEEIWSLDLIRTSTPDVASIENQCIEMESIAQSAGATYDGWGTEIEK